MKTQIPQSKLKFLGTLLFTLFFVTTAIAGDYDFNLMKAPDSDSTKKRFTSFLPLGADAMRASGQYMELPFAIGVDGTGFRGITNVTNLAVKFRDFDDEFENISDFAEIGDVVNSGSSFTTRLEANILPFFKAFIIGGYSIMDLDMKIRVGERGGQDPWILEIKDDNKFYTVGGGGSVFFGKDAIFGVVDVSYMTSIDQDPQPGDLTTDVETLITGVRVGYANPNKKQRPWAIWTGFSGTASTVNVQGTQQGIPIIGTIDYQVDQRAIDRNAILLGGQYFISDHIQLMYDSDFSIRNQYRLTLSLNVRF